MSGLEIELKIRRVDKQIEEWHKGFVDGLEDGLGFIIVKLADYPVNLRRFSPFSVSKKGSFLFSWQLRRETLATSRRAAHTRKSKPTPIAEGLGGRGL
ncbi:hypothetical protein, partial [Paenibacillus lautus]|uniref:hypothetical protein n=1 Tax=Paenibacillus lautus TaxID=1401 RepID=UPI001C3F530B